MRFYFGLVLALFGCGKANDGRFGSDFLIGIAIAGAG